MKLLSLFSLSLLLCLALAKGGQPYIIYDPNQGDEVPSLIKNPLPQLPLDELPTDFSWGDVDGTNYLTVVKNHHIPNYCGGCFAFATTSSLSDRIKIMRKGQGPDILLSPQMMLSCSNNRGCHGGASIYVHKYVHDYGITDETCSPYKARGLENGAPCTDELKCSVCDSEGNCSVPESYPVYYLSEYGRAKGVQQMMNEIYARGPIECMIASSYVEDYVDGIVNFTTTGTWALDHYIAVVGWGEENGIPYWLARNSWGSFWGLHGFFKILRGQNTIGIETTCTWGVPIDTWSNNTRNYTNTTTIKAFNAARPQEPELMSFLAIDEAVRADPASCVKTDPTLIRHSSKTGQAQWRQFPAYELPPRWDWRNVDGQNYVSAQAAQNTPFFCASCWAIAATTALSSRITILRKAAFPVITLSVQALINCQAGGGCSGGDPLSVYKFAHDHGIPDGSCQNYVAQDPAAATCSPLQVCKNCEPPAVYANGTDPANCEGIVEYDNWKVSDYGVLSGVAEMKTAIYQDGPIACGIVETPELRKYTGGVFSQKSGRSKGSGDLNHEVTVVGWDVDENGVEYWIVSNSWGTYWGDRGFGKIQMYQNNLGIERECVWATPINQDISKVTFKNHISEELVEVFRL